MRGQPWPAQRVFLGAVDGFGLLVLLLVLPALDLNDVPVRSWLLVALVVLTELRPVRLPRLKGQSVEITVSPPFLFALLLLQGLPLAIATGVVASFVVDVARRKPLQKTVFNVAQYTLQLAAAGVVLDWLAPARPLAGMEAATLVALTVAGGAFVAINIGLVAAAISLEATAPLRIVAKELSGEAVTLTVLLGLAPIVVVTALHAGPLVVLFLVPAVAVHRSAQLLVERRQSVHQDDITGLPNHVALREQGPDMLGYGGGPSRVASLLLADLDRFRELNNNFGHATGDRVLRLVADRMRGILPNEALLARVGGDEFAVLLVGTEAEDAVELARRVRLALAEPFTVASLTLPVDVTVGIAVRQPGSDDELAELMQQADVALHLAKETRSGVEVYRAAGERDRRRRMSLIADLQRAFDSDELTLHYQPCVEVATGRVPAVEALLRWDHPQYGSISPGELVPMLEQTAHIHRLTRWVLETALRQSKAWRAHGAEVRIAVNLSARDLEDPDFPLAVLDLLSRFGVPGTALEMEITESAIMQDPGMAARVLSQLAASGVRIAIDDFGTGQASLSYLKWLPVDALKVDQSFIRGMAADPTDAAIVQATVDLARRLGLEVTAEGIEDSRTWTAVAEAGFDYGQGRFLSAPVGAVAVAELLGIGSDEAVGRGLLELHPPRLWQEQVAEGDQDHGRGHGGGGGPEAAEAVDEQAEGHQTGDGAQDR